MEADVDKRRLSAAGELPVPAACWSGEASDLQAGFMQNEDTPWSETH